MTKHIIVAVKDRAVDALNRPIFVPHRNAAIRSFADETNRAGSEMNQHPEDYDLYQLGTWDDETGRFEQDEKTAQLIARAQDLIKRD